MYLGNWRARPGVGNGGGFRAGSPGGACYTLPAPGRTIPSPRRGLMTDPGLTRRLRQHSHRSGLAIGLSMALAIAVCFGGFTWLYVQLDPWVRDFAGVEPAPTSTPRSSASRDDAGDDSTSEDEQENEDEPAPTRTPRPDDED